MLVYRSWPYHRTVTKTLLSVAFLPLLKSHLKNPDNTSSYRAIVGSSLILKLFEKTIMVIWGGYLTTDTLQFGFKAGTSTMQCSWLFHEVVTHYLRHGSHPIVTVLDCSRAFDLCNYDKIFTAILDRGVPPTVVRAMMYSYTDQQAYMRWGRARSETFSVQNRTGQGKIMSLTLWSVYMDPLLTRLREVGLGCHIGGVFLGVVA